MICCCFLGCTFWNGGFTQIIDIKVIEVWIEGEPWHIQFSQVESIYSQQANLRSFKGNGKVIF